MNRRLFSPWIVAVAVVTASACPGSPCFTMLQLEGHYDLLGTLFNNDLIPWPDDETSILITAGPNRVYGYTGETLVEESSVYITCSVILSYPGLSDDFGPFRPLGPQNSCFRLYFDWPTDFFAFECQPPCLLVWANDNFIASYVYQSRHTSVDLVVSSWSSVRALFGR